MITSYDFLANWLRARFDDEKGASLVEYALLVALIAVVCIAASHVARQQRLVEVRQRRQRRIDYDQQTPVHGGSTARQRKSVPGPAGDGQPHAVSGARR